MSWAAAAGAVANIFGGQMANQANSSSTEKQMKMQKHMSDTAHLREVRDLKSAGLNPILSANAGASTPGGASYSSEAPSVDPMLFENSKQSNAQTANIKTDTGLKAANTKSAEKSLEIAEETKKLLKAQTATQGQNARQAKIQADLSDRYGDANQMMGLISSGTGAVGNVLSVPALIKNIFKPNKNTIRENYTPQGEHRGTTHTRTYND